MKFKQLIIPTILILIGESVFILPFLVTRIFRPTFLKVFDITNFQLGAAFSVYGIIAAISYFFGGPIADKFSPKQLLSASLATTAIAGFGMARIPSIEILTVLYGIWGLSTILLFWAAFIKAIRLFWTEQKQGQGYGIVDAGRGIFAAFLASISVFLLDYMLPVSSELASLDDLSNALSTVILLFSIITFLCSLLVFFFLPKENSKQIAAEKFDLKRIKDVAKRRSIWLNAIIVLCAYVGYKCTDDFSLYAAEVLNYNDVDAAHIGTIFFWIRPFAALAAGLLGDRFLHSNMIRLCFIILIVASLFIFSGLGDSSIELIVIITLAISSIGIYGLRGLYFATVGEAKIPLLFTGSAVGLISVIGYTPDIFFGPLMGQVLDSYPGEQGHQYLFGILTLFSCAGLIATSLFKKSY
ncbi:MAG: MFS transporter [Flavobacteriales bacterium]|nr:MFS transporter [Flavobacteriales bacterium]